MTEKKKTSRFKSVRSEMKKVSWPTKSNLINYTVTVVAISVIVALFCWVLDIVFGRIIGMVL